MQTDAQTISDFGVAPYSVGVDVGWPLSDLFENIYLRTAGPDMYDQLAKHEIPWTDPSVTDALTKMGDIIGNGDLIAGGTSGALQTDFTGSVTQMFADPPEGAMLFEGNFVGGVINGETQSKVGPDADFFDFPSIDGSPPAVMGGGDLAALLKDSRAGRHCSSSSRHRRRPRSGPGWADTSRRTRTWTCRRTRIRSTSAPHRR